MNMMGSWIVIDWVLQQCVMIFSNEGYGYVVDGDEDGHRKQE